MAFNLDDYEPVEERIKRFYSDHEDGRILTELASDVNKLDIVVVKAFVYTGDTVVSTGLAFEISGAGFVNKTSHLENCETSAIGRALANFNYAGSKRPSKEEMEKVKRGKSDGKKDHKRQALIDDIGAEIKDSGLPEKEISLYRESIKTTPTDKLQEILTEVKKSKKLMESDITVEDTGINQAFDGKEVKEEKDQEELIY